MKSSRNLAALIIAFSLLAGLALWQSHRRTNSAVPARFSPSEKVKAKLQAMREQLAARMQRPNSATPVKQLNAAAATATFKTAAQAPTFEIGANPALEAEAEDLGGIEIPKNEDQRAQTIRTEARDAQNRARQRFEKIKKLYDFIPELTFDKHELVKKDLQQNNPDLKQINDWRAVLPKLPRFQWETYQAYVNVHNQGKCNQCWAFAAMGAYEANVRIIQSLGETTLDSNVEPAMLEKAPLPAGFRLLSDWTMRPDKFEICRELVNDQNLKQSECRPVNYSKLQRPPMTQTDDQIRQLAAQVIKKQDPCDTTGWHGTAFNYMLTLATENFAFPEIVAWGYVNYPPSQVPTVEQLKVALLEHGPLIALVYMDKFFQGYQSGVFNEQSTTEVNHAVLLTGWDDEKKAWRIQNSFGLEWGEEGKMWIAYGSNSIGKYAAWLEVH